MIILNSTTQSITIESSEDVTINCHVSWIDLNSSLVTPGAFTVAEDFAGTYTLVASPSLGTSRNVKEISVRNTDGAIVTEITIMFDDSILSPVELIKIRLPAGHGLYLFEDRGWHVVDNFGRIVESSTISDTLYYKNLDFLPSGVGITGSIADVLENIDDLSFPVISGNTYWFNFYVHYTAEDTTTGSRWTIDGPASPTFLSYKSRYALTDSTETLNLGLTDYNLPTGSNASSASLGSNIAMIDGMIQPSADGDVVLRFAAEVTGSAITALPGSFIEWMRVK